MARPQTEMHQAHRVGTDIDDGDITFNGEFLGNRGEVRYLRQLSLPWPVSTGG